MPQRNCKPFTFPDSAFTFSVWGISRVWWTNSRVHISVAVFSATILCISCVVYVTQVTSLFTYEPCMYCIRECGDGATSLKTFKRSISCVCPQESIVSLVPQSSRERGQKYILFAPKVHITAINGQ